MKKPTPKIRKHPGFDFLAPYLGKCKEPETVADKLIELMDGTLTFDGFPGFEEGVFVVADILEEHNVDTQDKLGGKVLQAYIDHALHETYGDFYRSRECPQCGKEFKPVYELEYVYEVLAHNGRCPMCISQRIES